MRAILIILLAVILGGGGAFMWRYYGGFEGERSESIAFIDVYGEYRNVSDQVETYVHLPGTAGNKERSELLSLLEVILTKEMDSARREELARLAFSNLDAIKKEIDAAQATQAKLYEVLQNLDAASKEFSSLELRGDVEEIVLLGRKRAELSARITSILSETNDLTYAIITRILSEKGELSQEHIEAINAMTTDAEKRFATLEGLYVDLLSKKEEMDVKFTEFVQIAL